MVSRSVSSIYRRLCWPPEKAAYIMRYLQISQKAPTPHPCEAKAGFSIRC